MLCTRFTDTSVNIGYIAYTVSRLVRKFTRKFMKLLNSKFSPFKTTIETIAEN